MSGWWAGGLGSGIGLEGSSSACQAVSARGPNPRADPGHQEHSEAAVVEPREPQHRPAATCCGHVSRPGSPLRSGALGLAGESLPHLRISWSEDTARPQRAQPSSAGPRLRLRAPDRQNTKPCGAAHANRASCAPPTSKARHRASPAAPSFREAISLGMSESTRDQRMIPRLAPVAFVDQTVPRATEGGKSAKEGHGGQGQGQGGGGTGHLRRRREQ
jgi:hypothetical protein